ncbi:hypothetical protein EOI86_04930 [Hwanghaeella grinnelliae]|uniref:Gfo/Idh/MocA-like oxidoreductase N-terminal domain-containing protein n=2 Tax=Hwanghaeella grinnelliae TaxID=2500179 RepID=A0A3S2Y6K4_9PROT|nr:hypothetical protein EOI86_04930 [Hwanghaeella grinnelliae]
MTQPPLRLLAVATRREESAKASAKDFGAEKWFSAPYQMLADPEIDIITVAVKVPAHRDPMPLTRYGSFRPRIRYRACCLFPIG